MGYRSDIYIKVKKEDQEQLVEKFKEADLFSSFQESSEHDDEYVRYIGTWLKWYESYEDVKIINDFINEGTDDNPRGLIAVGEDSQTTHYGDTQELDMFEITSVSW
jgi:hypothetical protein